MSLKINQVAVMPNLSDGVSVPIGEPGVGVTLKDQMLSARKCTVTLTAFSIAVLAANDYGGTKIMYLPVRNMLLLGMEVNCVVTKQGNTNGIVAATDITMSVGSAVAAATPLATTAIDVVEATAMTADTLAVNFQKHSNDQATIVFPLKVVDGANTALFMNLAATITANSSVLVDGTIDIYYVDLGKRA